MMNNNMNGSINGHYLINELNGFTNFDGDKVTSVRFSDTDHDILVIRMYVIIEDMNLQHIHERITVETRLNINTLEYAVKPEGKGSRKYGDKARLSATQVINGAIEYATLDYKSDIADASLMTQSYYHSILESAGADTAELNDMVYKISNGMGVMAAEAITKSILEKLESEKEDDTINVKRIEITRAEGRSEDRFTAIANNFEQAVKIIELMALSAPNDGSYDKTDFTVEWEDGQLYDGRLDLQHHMTKGYDLRDQMRAMIPRMAKSEVQANEFITKYLTA